MFLSPLVIWGLAGPQVTYSCRGNHGCLLRVKGVRRQLLLEVSIKYATKPNQI